MRLANRVAIVAWMLAAAGPAAAQRATISGSVTDSAGSALAGVVVRVEGLLIRSLSDASGKYELTGVPLGTFTVRAALLGYTPSSRIVVVGPTGATNVNFTLGRVALQLEPIDVVVGSRARHTAADELAVPVDVYPAEQLTRQGSSETSQILQSLSPAVNFPRQSVTDATDVVRPFTLRGLSPDQTLVLVNGLRRHQMAVVNTFGYGMPAGSSGVDMNALPASAIERIEVLRDGASAQYGSDAIAGVVNVVLKEGRFAPSITAMSGQYVVGDYPDDGETVDVNGAWGIGLGRGSLALFGGYLDRQRTNRAWADRFDVSGTGVADSVNDHGQVVVKHNPVPQPNHHWGDGLERDVLSMANFRLPLNDAGTSEFYTFGGYSFRHGTGNGYRRYEGSERNWPQIYPLGFLPEFAPDVTDYSVAGGFRTVAGGWSLQFGTEFGHNDFKYELRNTLNTSLGPCLAPAAPCAPGNDGILGNGDDPGIPNQTSFFAGQLRRQELVTEINATSTLNVGLPRPLNVSLGAAFRRESYRIREGERASWIDGGDTTQAGSDAPGGSQVFPGFAPSDTSSSSRTNVGAYLDLETDLAGGVLANLAGRFEHYNDFGSVVTGKAALRLQPSPRLTLRAAASTGFRAPGLGQIHFSKVVTNVIAGAFEEVGIFPVDHPAARALGSKPLKRETSLNLSSGLAFSPRDNVTFTADYFYIKLKDRILLGATFDDATTLAILAANGFSNIGGVQYFTNGLDTRTQGVDFTGTLRFTAAAGVFELTGVANYTKNDIVRVDPLPAVLQNSAETGLIDTVTWIGITEERPDWRATLTGEYSTGRFRSLVRASYFGGFASAQPGFCDLCRETYGAKTLFDAEVGYHLGLMDLAIGVRNLFDTYPDQPKSSMVVDSFGDTSKDFNDNFGTFPWAAASPFGYNGRFVYGRARIQLSR